MCGFYFSWINIVNINCSLICSFFIQFSIRSQDMMAGWHHGLDGRESEWTPGDGDGEGGLACCDSWGRKELGTTERLNWTKLILIFYEITKLVFKVFVPFCIDTSKDWEFLLPYILTSIWCCQCSRSWCLIGVKQHHIAF